ncbi:MAG TPA: hypothetical protein VJT73_09920 [Polyangiaceae bacterium]|nr:hypothetical protein [Polyangiaceae bacterium]
MGVQTKVDRGRIRKWALPSLGPKPVAAITSSDLEAIVEVLDREVAADVMKWKNAANIWGVVAKAFDDASAPR